MQQYIQYITGALGTRGFPQGDATERLCENLAITLGSSPRKLSPDLFKGFGQKRTKPERNTRSMAAEGRYGQKSRGACHFLRGISELAAQILAPGWLVRGGHLDDELWLLAWQVEAAAADKRFAKRRCFAGQDAHVVCMLAADTCRMPSLAGI